MASRRIKGITIEIDGSTTGLEKALGGVNSDLSKTQNALRDVDRLLKIDPKNTELLAQKQKILSQAVDETKEKLEIEKTALEQAANTDMPADKMDALKREIIATTQELENLERQSKDMAGSLGSSMQEAGQKIKGIGDKTVEIGKRFSTHVTAPIVAVGTASIAAFNEVDAGMDIVKEKTGAAGEALSDMEDIAKRIATNIPTDFEAAGSAVGEVNTRFSLTGDELEKLSEKFIKFAKLNDTDVSGSIDNTQKVLTAFGLTVDEAGGMLDTMNAVGQRTGIGMDDLAKSMITNASSLKQMGFSASDAANFLGNVEMSGADASQVMSGLTKALSNATAEGKPMNEALSEIQNSMVNAESETKGLQVAYDLFGKRAGAAIYQVCREGSLSFEELGTSMDENIGSVEDTYEKTLDGTDKFKTGMNSLKVAGSEFGEVVGNVIAPMIERVSEKIKEITERFSELSPHTKEMIVKIGMIIAAIGPLLIIAGTVISTIGKVVSGMGTFLTFLGGISAPVAAAVAAVGVFVAAVVHLWNTSEEFRDSITAIWERVQSAFKAFSDGILERLSGMGLEFESITEVIKAVWDGFCNLLAPVIEGALSVVVTKLETAFNVILGIWDMFSAVFSGDWAGAWEAVKSIFSDVWAGAVKILSTQINVIKGIADVFLGWFGTDWETVWNSVKSFFEGIWDGIVKKFEAAKKTLENAWNAMKTTASNTWNAIKTAIETPINAAKTEVSTAIDAIRNTVRSVFDSVKATVTTTWNNIKSAIENPINAAKTAVQRAIDAIRRVFKFTWSLPKLKLPHFSITGKFSLDPPQVPHFDIQWYKNGGIMTDPTVFGMKGGDVLAGGEAGPEAILPLEPFYSRLAQILDSKLADVREKIVIELPVYVSGNYSKTEIAEIAEKGISRSQKFNARGAKVNVRQYT